MAEKGRSWVMGRIRREDPHKMHSMSSSGEEERRKEERRRRKKKKKKKKKKPHITDFE